MREELVFRAGLSRFAVGGAALVALPLVHPAMRSIAWVFALYLVIALGEQILIRRSLGGSMRTILFGMVDGAVITFTLHQLGSCSTPLVTIYLFAGVMNALVIGPREGLALSLLNAAAYGAVVWLELGRVISYAPSVPLVAAIGPPSAGSAILATGLVAFLMITTTAVVSSLMTTLGARERALMSANESLESVSRRDVLTGLYNRRFLFERIAAELLVGEVSLVMLDLDSFKHVNDAQGHLRGDLLLEEIGAALRQASRAGDVAARYGGDEFVVLLPRTSAAQAQVVADRITAAIGAVGARFDAQRPVTASVGVTISQSGDGVAALLRRADDAAYEAKRAGGNRVKLAS